MTRPVVLISESAGFCPSAAQRLREFAEVRLADLDRGELLSQVRDVDVLWVRLRHQIDREVFEAAPHLRMIATATTGLNHVDLEEARRRNVKVVSLKDAQEFLRSVPATAEHTIALALALLRNVPAAAEHVRHGYWNRDLFRGRDLCGKTAGLVGYGRIGRLVSRYLSAFGVRVLATDRNVNLPEAGVAMVSLQELLEQSDIVSLHASYSQENAGMIGRREFECMRPGTWFINTARGELVDEKALIDALRDRTLAGAALDVLAEENTGRNRELIEYARQNGNLLITPHIGGCTQESMEKTEIFLAGRLATALDSVHCQCAG
ncbi:MAG TPA: NAD(P)-dependent oxidoreductase [Bryobacteraceae bacterium]|nr:NAD(P)-dependent oxidoreductase [Bryobacteraceae bacterium]